MPVLRAIALVLALVESGSPALARQDGVPPPRMRRPRVVAPLSDLMVHSPLAGCRAGPRRIAAAPARVRIATWNIRAAQSAPVDEIAAELRAMRADVVALQEVDVRTRRGGFVDEPGVLAAALGFHYVFAASIKWDEGDYGLAVLSRWPVTAARRHRLDSEAGAEPRIALEIIVCVDGRPLRLFNHHADRRMGSRALGFANLRRILQAHVGRGVLLMGDLNEYPDAPGVRSLLDAGFSDLAPGQPGNTTRLGRVDYLLADRPLARLASDARVWSTAKSDHHAVLADLEW